MDPLSLRPSIPVTSGTLHHINSLLAKIENLDGTPTGVLSFQPHGQIYLESGKICWAVVPGQQQRLGQLLRYQRNPPIDPQLLRQIVRQCREDHVPLGEALLASGEITGDGLRSALLSHTAESIARIANSNWHVDHFDAPTQCKYDARFVFSTVEVLTHLGVGKNLTLAAIARKTLMQAVADGGNGLAFLRNASINHPIMIAVTPQLRTTVKQARDICSWTSSIFDLARTVDPTVHVASGSWRGNQAVLAWQVGDISYAGLFSNRAAATLALSKICDEHNKNHQSERTNNAHSAG